jgi:hypothetical protein
MTFDDPACTLPTADRPLRVAEFDSLFTAGLRGQERLSPTWLRWRLDPSFLSDARSLAARETACCSFFSFGFTSDDHLDVQVPPAHVAILDALAARAAAALDAPA